MPEGNCWKASFDRGGVHREWCDPEVLRTDSPQDAGSLRKEVEPVEQSVLCARC